MSQSVWLCVCRSLAVSPHHLFYEGASYPGNTNLIDIQSILRGHSGGVDAVNASLTSLIITDGVVRTHLET